LCGPLERLPSFCEICFGLLIQTSVRITGCGEVRFLFVMQASFNLLEYKVNRWLSIRFNLLSTIIIGVTASVAILNPSIDASLTGFMLAFAATITNDVRTSIFLVEPLE
jgi:hypothetical protein